MADTLALDIRGSLTWLFQESLDLTTVSDASKLEYDVNLADGTGDSQADKLWHDERTLAASANDDLDLTSLATTLFGSAVTIALAKVKALLLVNTATTAGLDLLVGAAASQEWSGPFGSAGDQVRVPADSCLLLVNKKSGWAVADGSADTLRIHNPSGAPITFKIAIVGTSA